MRIVTNIATLKAMAKRGLIKLHAQTGSKIAGLNSREKFTCTYVVDYGPKGSSGFTYQGCRYKLTYIPGCFCLYVEQIG